MNPSAVTHCSECGAVIPGSAMGLICPSCLLGGLFEDEAMPALRGGVLFSIPGHEVRRELGRGGMGIVYLAHQSDPPRDVALKMLLPAQGMSREIRERFRMEATTVAALDHPHILPVYATGEHDGLPWFTLKLAGGGTLAERAGDYAGRWREIAELAATLAEAVNFAHQRGVLHRDLKPGNVMFDDQGAAYITDFGLAKWTGPGSIESHALTMAGSAMGTPHYLTPEVAKQGAGAATAASDVYGLGAILYELLTGQPPFTAESTPELMRRIYNDPVMPPVRVRPDVPRDLSAVAVKCLEKEPAQRYESALTLAADLRSWLDGRGVRARPLSNPARLWRWARRNPALAGTAAALLAALAAGAVLQIRSNRQLRSALADSLLSQARMTATGREQGARDAGMHLLREADANGANSSPDLAARRRTEIARTLALPELRQTAAWVAPSSSSEGGESFSPDLARYLGATPDGGFAMHDTATRSVLQAWPPPQEERAARLRTSALRMNLSPDEKLAAVIFAGDSSAPAMLRVVALADGRTIGEWPCDNTSREWPLWLSHGGFLFANTRTNCLRADAHGNVSPYPDAARAPDVLPLALHPDGRLVAVATKAAKTLTVLVVESGAEQWRTPLLEVPGPVAWSPDGFLLAAGERHRAMMPDEAAGARPGFEIILFNAQTGSLRAELQGHAAPLAHVCFLQGRRSVASISVEQGMIWQEARTGGFRLTAPAQPRVLQSDKSGTRLAWSPAQGSLCIAEAMLPAGWRLWDESTEDGITCGGISSDGARLFLATKQNLQIWDTAARRRLHRQQWPAHFTKGWPWFVVTPDGTQIVVGDQGQPLHAVPVIAAADGTPRAMSGIPQPRGPGNEFYMIHSFSPQGGWVVCDGPAGRTVQRGRTYAIWPEGDHTRAHVVARDITASSMHLLGEDGRWALAAGRNGKDCGVWDARDGRSLGMAGIDDALGVNTSRDRRYAVLAGRSQIAFWEAATQRTGASWSSPPGVGGNLPQFSPDNRLLAVYDHSGSIFLHEVPSGRPWLTLSVPGGFPLWHIEWAGARRLVWIGSDGRIGEWDTGDTERAAAEAGLPW